MMSSSSAKHSPSTGRSAARATSERKVARPQPNDLTCPSKRNSHSGGAFQGSRIRAGLRAPSIMPSRASREASSSGSTSGPATNTNSQSVRSGSASRAAWTPIGDPWATRTAVLPRLRWIPRISHLSLPRLRAFGRRLFMVCGRLPTPRRQRRQVKGFGAQPRPQGRFLQPHLSALNRPEIRAPGSIQLEAQRNGVTRGGMDGERPAVPPAQIKKLVDIADLQSKIGPKQELRVIGHPLIGGKPSHGKKLGAPDHRSGVQERVPRPASQRRRNVERKTDRRHLLLDFVHAEFMRPHKVAIRPPHLLTEYFQAVR